MIIEKRNKKAITVQLLCTKILMKNDFIMAKIFSCLLLVVLINEHLPDLTP